MVIMRKYLLFIILFSGLCLGARGQSDPEIDLSGLPQQTTAKSLRYWFDTDAGSVQTTTTLSGATTIEASALVEDVKRFHSRESATFLHTLARGLPIWQTPTPLHDLLTDFCLRGLPFPQSRGMHHFCLVPPLFPLETLHVGRIPLH